MPPQVLSAGLVILEAAIADEPAIAADIKELLTKAEPTKADWEALRAKWASKSYRDYVPDSALPADTAS